MQITTERDCLPRVPRRSGFEPDRGSGTHTHPQTHTGPPTDSPSLIELMRMSREEWDLWTRGSAIRRAGYDGFKRNVAIDICNWLVDLDKPPEEAVVVLWDALDES